MIGVDAGSFFFAGYEIDFDRVKGEPLRLAAFGWAISLGLAYGLGGFVAGMIVRIALRGRELAIFESKLTAVGFGFLIPFFFVTGGLDFDLDALLSGLEPILKMLLFLGLFLVVRGLPALLLYRRPLPRQRDRNALAFFSATQLPLVVAITTLAVSEGEMTSQTAASLVGAAILSTLIFPFARIALRRGSREAPVGVEPAPG